LVFCRGEGSEVGSAFVGGWVVGSGFVGRAAAFYLAIPDFFPIFVALI
jgi:hypothetical protein